MLKHENLCLETFKEDNGTPALLEECNDINANQVSGSVLWGIS